MAACQDPCVDKIYAEISEKFSISELNDHQKDVIEAQLSGSDILVCTRTGSGKSLMYQAGLIVDENRNTNDTPDDAQEDVHHAHAAGENDELSCMDISPDISFTRMSETYDHSLRVIVVVVPLLAIMKEHCEKLEKLGYKATYIGKDSDEDIVIRSGEFNFVYGRPEDLLGKQTWRDMLSSVVYREKMVMFVVDEAHAVINW
jgi:superfamily II DNA helicase RecQ